MRMMKHAADVNFAHGVISPPFSTSLPFFLAFVSLSRP